MDKGKNEATASTPPIDKNEATTSTPPIDDLKSPTTPDDLSYSSKTDWDPKYQFEAMAKYFRRQNQLMKDEFRNQVDELTEQIKKLTAQSTTSQEDHHDRPRAPFRQAIHFERPRFGDGDGLLNNIKTSIPEFEGLHDPDLYLDWECKVDKISTCYDFSEIKKVQLASMEFRGYAASWWEIQQERRQLEKKLNLFKQGTRSVEEYHKELDTALNRVGKKETLNATIIRYIEGMNLDIACEVEFKDFNSVEEMVQYASIVERQLREG
ncbi:hypothetical protein C2S53_000531 [Perilla frutescens var. hirtella]|uniref:Retrotransposon gag domain-containing protein n=1 Tax=Perilla frutescens var. hirtella TaxID=608512 RepID=A0AAD4JKV2_PERFH|nr:hypothetical protein C2S53_000531 [Perilla frutescens var. hirtella]